MPGDPAKPVRLFVHEHAFDEAARTDQGVDLLFGRVLRAFAGGLVMTGGSTVKTLRGPYGGQAFRVRAGSLRVPVSRVEWKGEERLYVHQVEQRGRIYESEQFRLRLENFHRRCWDDNAGSWVAGEPRDYTDLTDHLAASNSDEGTEAVVIEPYLSDQQARVLNALLPFPGQWNDRDTVVLIGRGAPGSGKTVVAAEAARAAQEVCGYSVLVLCPTPRLRAGIGTAFEQGGMQAGGFSMADTPPLCLEESQRFMAAVAGSPMPDPGRGRALQECWGRVLSMAAFHRYRRKHPEITSARFVRLVDAALTDPVEVEGRSRDPLDRADADLYKRLRDLRDNRSWYRTILDEFKAAGLMLRCQVAERASKRIGSQKFWPGDLLILVDETQDLAPIELRLLLDWAVARRRVHPGTRLALFGDENQRVAPTAFAWADVREHMTEAHRLDRRCISEVELPGSYRLGRSVATFASLAFAPVMTEMEGSRRISLPDVAVLREGGQVRLVSCDSPEEELGQAARSFAAARPSDERLIVIAEDPTPDQAMGLSEHGVELLSTRMAKGLEFRTVVVVEPFGTSSGKMGFNQAATAFTALTRATDRMLVMVSDAMGKRIAEVMTEGSAPVEQIVLAGGGKIAALTQLLLEFAENLPLEQQVELALAQWDELVERIEAAADDLPSDELARDAVIAARRMLLLGGADQVAGMAASALVGHPRLEAPVRSLIVERREAGQHEDVVAGLLLLGEKGLGTGYVRAITPGTKEHLTTLGAATVNLTMGPVDSEIAAACENERGGAFERPGAELLRGTVRMYLERELVGELDERN